MTCHRKDTIPHIASISQARMRWFFEGSRYVFCRRIWTNRMKPL